MLISTKGRYALRVMLELSDHDREDYVPLSVIAKKQEISEKYLESILVVLSKAGAIDALRGKGGGYRLNRDPKDSAASCAWWRVHLRRSPASTASRTPAHAPQNAARCRCGKSSTR